MGIRNSWDISMGGRFIQTDPMGYHDSMNLYQALNINPVNFYDPTGMKFIKYDVIALIDVNKKNGRDAVKKWIDGNANFDSTDKLQLHSMLIFGVKDPREAEAEKYETNALTVIGDTVDGMAYDIAGNTYCELAGGTLTNDGSLLASGLLDIGIAGVAVGLASHYVPMGMEKLAEAFFVLTEDVTALTRQGIDKARSAYQNSALSSGSGHIGGVRASGEVGV